jgi:hypothetical protein
MFCKKQNKDRILKSVRGRKSIFKGKFTRLRFLSSNYKGQEGMEHCISSNNNNKNLAGIFQVQGQPELQIQTLSEKPKEKKMKQTNHPANQDFYNQQGYPSESKEK